MATEKVTESFVQLAIPRFDGHYDHWSMLMENFLRSKEYWHLVESRIDSPAGVTSTEQQQKRFGEQKMKDLKVKHYLFQAIDRCILKTILEKETSKQIWDSMKKKYEGSERVKRALLQTLTRDFETLQMKSGESITDFFARTLGIVNRMRSNGGNMEEVKVVEKILRSLTPKFDYVVCSIKESQRMLLRCELRSMIKKHGTWDTDCSNHMSGCKSSFVNLDESFRSVVSFGDKSTVNVMGNGDIQIRTKNDFVETIANIFFFIPHLKTSLLSAGQLQDKGYGIRIFKGECEVYDPKRCSIAMVKMSSNMLFPLKINTIQASLLTIEDDSWRWHYKYGHLNFNGLRTLHQKEMVTGLPKITSPSKFCEACITGKHQRDSFPSGKVVRAQSVLKLVHSYLCGPINPISNGNKKYFISFIDDFSRKIWVYFLQEKSEAFDAFKSFKTLDENETDKRIKTHRTNKGGEFCSKEFDLFCREKGIKRHLTTTYTPQQNGVSERKNQAILNMVRSLLVKGKVTKKFWPEAVLW
ncbi:hypothetical protein ACE6H2_019855 [Prunus campanulata]